MILFVKLGTKMPKKRFVDTNVFIYTLFPIDQTKHEKSLALFQKSANGEIYLWTTDWVIAEIIWFLERQKMNITHIKEIITNIFENIGLEVEGKKFILRVLDAWNEGLDFIDAVNLTMVKEKSIKEGYSYDKGLDNFKWFTRLAP